MPRLALLWLMKAVRLRQHKLNDWNVFVGIAPVPVVVDAKQQRLDPRMRCQHRRTLPPADQERVGVFVKLKDQLGGELAADPSAASHVVDEAGKRGADRGVRQSGVCCRV